MRAALYDLTIETGVDFRRTFTPCTPAEPVPAREVVVGDRVYYKGEPLYVYMTTLHEHPTDPSLSSVEFLFGSGAWYEPRATVPADGLVYPTYPVTIAEASAGFSVMNEVGEVRVELPVDVTDPERVALALDDAATSDLVPYQGSWSWDLYARTDAWGWQRLVEGTLSVLKGSGRDAP